MLRGKNSSIEVYSIGVGEFHTNYGAEGDHRVRKTSIEESRIRDSTLPNGIRVETTHRAAAEGVQHYSQLQVQKQTGDLWQFLQSILR